MYIPCWVIYVSLQWWKNGDNWLRLFRDMIILIEWRENIFVQTVACIVKQEDPQIKSVRGMFNKFAVWGGWSR